MELDHFRTHVPCSTAQCRGTSYPSGEGETPNAYPLFMLLFFSLRLLSLLRYPFPTVFSTCSKKDLAARLEKGVGMCLYNMPEVKVLYGGQKCGNGYVEEGEECDCGEPEVRVTALINYLTIPPIDCLLLGEALTSTPSSILLLRHEVFNTE